MKLIKMPKIEQFRNIIHHINKATTFDGLDGDGNPIYTIKPSPTLRARGTVKLHGTNASVCYNKTEGIWVQSRKNIISVENDNAGFAFFANQNIDFFASLFQRIASDHLIDTTMNSIAIYGEWAGCGIQRGLGISEIDKKFYIFGIKIRPHDEELPSFWVKSNIFEPTETIHHIENFGIFEVDVDFKVDVDFNNPMLSNNKMVELVQKVESECPVAKHFGVSGIGEGIVFETEYKGNLYRWKMKGEKHSKSKVKKAKKVDDAKLQKIIDVVDQVTPGWRLEQMYQETFDTINGGKGDIKGTGDFIRAVIRDVIKEDSDIIADAGLEPKEISPMVAKESRLWLIKKLDEEAGI